MVVSNDGAPYPHLPRYQRAGCRAAAYINFHAEMGVREGHAARGCRAVTSDAVCRRIPITNANTAFAEATANCGGGMPQNGG